jgi:hypothetical protein
MTTAYEPTKAVIEAGELLQLLAFSAGSPTDKDAVAARILRYQPLRAGFTEGAQDVFRQPD